MDGTRYLVKYSLSTSQINGALLLVFKVDGPWSLPSPWSLVMTMEETKLNI